MKLSIAKGSTSVLVRIFLSDSSSTTGAGLTGLTSGSSGLVCYRARDDDGNAGGTAISLSGGTRGTWSSGGFVEKDSTNMPGIYEFGIPDAALATGSRSVDIMFKGATNLAPLPMEIELTGWNNQDAVHGGLSAIPNATAGAAGGIFIAGTNAPVTITGSGAALTLTSTGGNGQGMNITGQGSGAGVLINAGSGGKGINILTTAGDGISVEPTGGHAMKLLGNGTAKHGLFAIGASAGATSDGINATAGNGGVDIRGAITGNITGNLSGSVGSVTAETTANVTHINSVATSSVTTVNANVGTTQPVNFTGTGASALAKSDMVDIAGAAVSTSTAQIGVNTVNLGGTAQTGRDIGASVLLSSGTGTGQIKIASGYVAPNWGDVGNPTTTVNLSGTTIKAVTDAVTISAAAVWDYLTSSIVTAGSIGKLIVDNLNATITSRMATYSQPTGFLAATFPSGTIANTTNITAGTMTTTTNLTNAPTVGDFTSTMKSSLATATQGTIIEGSTTLQQSLRLANSANGAIVAGAATASLTIRDLADTKDRVTATVDADGNRTAVSLDLT
jgi:hypothetical protein